MSVRDPRSRRPKPSSAAAGATAAALALLAASGTAYALGGPSPGAVSAQTVKLPSGPGSVRGLADDAQVSSFTGQVQYSVPIDLPFGPGGFGPKLALGYAGELGNGPLGVGWGLSQTGIRRSLRLGVPSYTDADELEVSGLGDGGEMVRLPDGTYRLEAQGQTAIGRLVDGGFEVTSADGTVYRLGVTALGRKASGTQVASWYLEEVRHVSGQTIEYRYQQAGGEVYLSEVLWGPMVSGARAYRAEVRYEARPDAVVSYRTGFRVESAQRIDKIVVWSFGGQQRVVDLSYEANFALSRLSSVRVTSPDGLEALPQLSFHYAAATSAAMQTVPNVTGWTLNANGTSLFDVDDDGVMDLLRLTSTGHSYRRNLGGSFDVARTVPGAAGASLTSVRLLDLTGDSGAEMVWQQGSQWRVFQLAGSGVADKNWVSLGNWAGATSLQLASVAVADLDGDYRMDVLQVAGNSIQVRMGSESGLGAMEQLGAIDPARASTVFPGSSSTSFPDINGDGLADAVHLASTAMYLYLGKGNGQFEKYRDVPYPWTGAFDLSQIRLGDLDRDGLMDLAIVRAGNVAWYRGLANGTVMTTPIVLARPPGTDASVVVALADANGNGSEDLVWSSSTGMWLLDFAGSTSAGMLTSIDNGLGQTQSFGYAASAQLALAAQAAGTPWTLGMPISIPVTVQQRRSFGSGEPARSVRLDVRDGIYDRGERRFIGFAEAILTRPDPADGAPAADTVRQIQKFSTGPGLDRSLRGQLLLDRVENGAGTLLRETVYTATTMPIAGLPADQPKLRKPIISAIEERHHEGQGTPLVTRTELAYDADGRKIEEKRLGRLDLVGDENLVRRTYTSGRSVRGVRDLLCEERLYALDGATETLVGHAQLLYGDASSVAPLCDAGAGWQRVKRQYLTSEARWVNLSQASYDASGNRVQSTEEGVTRSLTYDAHGVNPLAEVVNATPTRQLRWEMTWDNVKGQPASVRDAAGVTTVLTYDGVGRLRTMARSGQLPHLEYRYSTSGPRPYTESFVFDGPLGAVTANPASWTPASRWRHTVSVSTSAGEPLFTATRLDASSWLVAERRKRDALGRTTQLADVYEQAGTLAQLVASAQPVTAPAQTIGYDALDRTTSQVLASGARTTYAYRAFEVVRATDGMAPVTRLLDGQGRIRRTSRTVNGVEEHVVATYDAAGRITSMKLPVAAGIVEHTYQYDSLGRLSVAQDPDIGVRHLVYDDAGHLTAHTNGAGQTTTYAYDGASRLTRSTGHDGAQFLYHYDDALDAATFQHTASRLARVDEPTGSVQLGYDAFGQLARMRRVVAGKTADQTTARSPSGLVLSQSDSAGLDFTLTYDAAGRANGISSAAIGGSGAVWQLEQQDAAGRPLRERFGNGVVQTHQRNSLGQATKLRVLRPAGAALYDVDVTHNAYGAIATMADVDGRGLDHTASFTYDAAARLTDATMGSGAGAFQMRYRYDGLQNMVRREATGPRSLGISLGQYRYGEPGPGGAPRGPRQLTSILPDVAAGSPPGAPTLTFDYDAAGRTTRQGAMTLTYNGFDQLTAVSGVPGGGTVTHAYGYDGTRVRTTAVGGAQTVWFSPEVSESSSGVRSYDVRIGERLVARIVRDPAILAALDRADTIAGGAALARGLWIALGGGGVLLLFAALAMPRSARRRGWAMALRGRMRAAGTAFTLASFVLTGCDTRALSFGIDSEERELGTSSVLYYHQAVGAGPALVTRADASLYDERRYEPYGASIDSYSEAAGTTGPGTVGNIDFTRDPHNSLNKQSDAATGWSDHGARWVAPELARWHTPDPPVKAPSGRFMVAPWDLHPYQYVNQNPVLYWDPDGRDKLPLPGEGTDLLVQDTNTSGYKLSSDAQAVLGPIFQRNWGFDVSKVTVHFGPVPEKAAAFAVGNTVIIDKGYWEKASTQQQLGLLGHEITHSVQYERLAAPGALSIGGGVAAGALVGGLVYGVAKKLDVDTEGSVIAGIVLGVVAAVLAYWAIDKAPLWHRYAGESGRPDNYGVPPALEVIPLSALDPVDKRFTLDQIGDRTMKEIDDLYAAEAAATPSGP